MTINTYRQKCIKQRGQYRRIQQQFITLRNKKQNIRHQQQSHQAYKLYPPNRIIPFRERQRDDSVRHARCTPPPKPPMQQHQHQNNEWQKVQQVNTP